MSHLVLRRAEMSYVLMLARCFVANGLADFAWDLFLRVDDADDRLLLLQQIADDCYLTCSFRIAARAFDVLYRTDPHPDYWKGKRGAILGAFRSVLTHVESADCIDELLQILNEDDHVECDQLKRIIWKWSQENII